VPIVTATTPMVPLPQPLHMAHGHHEPTQAARLCAPGRFATFVIGVAISLCFWFLCRGMRWLYELVLECCRG
jgi:hypothetical protein